MGFVRKRKLYQLDFTGTSLEGLAVSIRGMSVAEALSLADLGEMQAGDVEAEKVREVFEFVVSKIESWNLTDEQGFPVPPSAEEIMSWDAGEAFAAIAAWQASVMDAPAPLERRSNGGSKWGGPPIPMDVPSPNLPS